MIYEDVQKISNAAVAKITLLKNHFGKYFIRAIMAGFFIAVSRMGRLGQGLGCELHRKFCWMFYSFTDLCRWRCFWHSRLLCRFYRWKIVHRSRSDVLQSSAL